MKASSLAAYKIIGKGTQVKPLVSARIQGCSHTNLQNIQGVVYLYWANT
jgi:hypothetical protein